MNQPSNSGRSFVKRGLSSIAGVGMFGLVVAGFIHLSTSHSQSVVDRAIDLPLVPPIASSELASSQVDVNQEQAIQLNSAQIALREAQVAVSQSQAQLEQARINLSEFQAEHDKAKILSAQGKVTPQKVAIAKAAYDLATLQQELSLIGLQQSTAQLIAAKAEVSRLWRANTVQL